MTRIPVVVPMADPELDYYLNQFQAKPRTPRWWPKVIAICALFGGIYGAAMGSAINTTAGTAEVIGIAAAVMALLCGVPGARFGLFFGILNRARFARLLFGMLAAMGGAIFGGLLGVMAVMPLGAIVGSLGGWFLGRTLLRRGFFRRLLGGFVGVVLGACIGTIVLALQRDHAAALVGIAWGLGSGAIVGPLPLLLFVKMMDSLAPRRQTEDNVIDVKVMDAPNDQD
jgi:hypothetical protein